MDVAGRKRAHDRGPEGNIRNEVAVHDVDVNPVGTGRDDLGHLVRQMPHVGRQDRRGELDVVGKCAHENGSSLDIMTLEQRARCGHPRGVVRR